MNKCRKVIGIGWNYVLHAKELGSSVPKKPMFFLKPPSSIITEPEPIEIPQGTIVHHELELGVVIGKNGRDIAKQDAESYVKGYFLGLDMTARNVQEEAKKSGSPWTVAKGYDTFTPVGDFIAKSEIKDPSKLRLTLKVDGQVKQDGETSDMIFNRIPHLIEYVSSIMRLEEGDIILTGTPEGVGPVKAGQILEGSLVQDGKTVSSFKFSVIDRK
ncbi:hypothetical protein EDD86DRAFT_192683 [Gorgonomyces haynaldii]|nr:hypothetical protein EDD86DRAFT_192683 [Gorgonomyces haynaldii]